MDRTLEETRTDFAVAYDGPALVNAGMDARDLAQAVLGLDQVLQRANALLNGDRAFIALEITGTARGSFEVLLDLKQYFDGAIGVFSGDFFSALANLKELFWGTGGLVGGVFTGGLIGWVKWLRGRSIRVLQQDNQQVKLSVETDDGRLELSVPVELFKLHTDTTIREQLEAVVRPILKDGIDSVHFRDSSHRLESVNKEEAHYFIGRSQGSETVETIIPKQRLQVVRPNFALRGKWRLSDGASSRWYDIQDGNFNREVAEGRRRFGAGDIVEAEVRVLQSETPGGELTAEYSLTQILSHEAKAIQRQLPE